MLCCTSPVLFEFAACYALLMVATAAELKMYGHSNIASNAQTAQLSIVAQLMLDPEVPQHKSALFAFVLITTTVTASCMVPPKLSTAVRAAVGNASPCSVAQASMGGYTSQRLRTVLTASQRRARCPS